MVFYPKNKRIINLLERAVNDNIIIADSKNIRELCKYEELRYLRKKGLMYVGKDHRKNVSIAFFKNGVQRKKGGFVF